MALAIEKAKLEPAAQHHLGAVKCSHEHFRSWITKKAAAVAARAILLCCASHATQPCTVRRRRYKKQQHRQSLRCLRCMAFDLDAYSRAHKSRLARAPAQKRVTVSTGLAVRCVMLQHVYQHTFLWPSSPPRKLDAAHRNCWTSAQLLLSTTGVLHPSVISHRISEVRVFKTLKNI